MIRVFVLFILLFYCCLGFADTRQHEKIWGGAIIVGSLSNDDKIKYYLQPQLVLIDGKYKFHNSFLFAGVGYRPDPTRTFWLMNGYDITKRVDGEIRHIDIIREQINLVLIDNNLLNFTYVSRLEERKDLAERRWSIRVRQLFSTRWPFKCYERYSLALFDEIFFNINHPSWTNSHTLVDQNRIFIGLGTEIAKNTIIDVGYMNQYQFRTNDANNHVLYIFLNIAN